MKLKPVLFFCMISTGDRWNDTKDNLYNIYDYVDYLVIVDGTPEDKTLNENLKKLDKDNKIVWVEYPWHDNFPASRSKYLETVGQIITTYDLKNISPWIIRNDSDEAFSFELIKNLRKICTTADGKSITMIRVRAKDIMLNKNREPISSSISDYHKELIYKWYPNLRYVPACYGAPVHETLNIQHRPINLDESSGSNTKFFYEHRKSQGDTWKRALRNFYCGGSGDNYGELHPLWKPFREMLDKYMPNKPKTWKDYTSYLEEGSVHSEIKDWLIKYRWEGEKNRDFDKYPKSESEKFFENFDPINTMDYPGASEIKEGFMYYFWWLHPDEMLELPKEIVIESPLPDEAKKYYRENRGD